jgi:EmrB/QacA subfamily drug resistance transporter
MQARASASGQATTSRRLILALVLVAQFVVTIDATIVTVALPSIQSGLHFGSQLSLQWVINAYILLLGGFLLVGGRVGDLWWRRNAFVAGLALFTGASLVNGLAQSPAMLIGGRAAQGLGAALLTPAVLSIIVATFTDDAARTKALGAFSTVTAGAAAAGFVIGGSLTEVSWRWIFLVNVPIGIAGMLLAVRHVPNSRVADGRRHLIDVPGAIAVTGGVTLLAYAVVNAQAWGWGSGRFILTVAAAAVLLLAFIGIELRVSDPLVRLGIFRLRSLAAANMTMFVFVGGQFAMMFFPTLYMQQVLAYSPVQTGLAYLAWPVAMIGGSMAGQHAIPRFGARPVLAAGLALSAAGFFLISGIPDHGGYAADILPGFIVNAAGTGLAYATLFLVATMGVRGEEAGLAAGIINSSMQLGSAIGLAILATIAADRTSHLLAVHASSAHALSAGFRLGFLISGVLVSAATIISIVAIRRRDLGQAPAEALADAGQEAAGKEAVVHEPG